MSKGFVIRANNTRELDSILCAETLAQSIYRVMPNAKVSIITTDPVERKLFDKVINASLDDWQIYQATPYDHTIKLAANMYVARSIEHWWDVLKQRDFAVCTTVRNFKQEIVDTSTNRKFISDNKFPNCYSAITYFNKSITAEKFFLIVENVFNNWEYYRKDLKCNTDEPITLDWAYAIASHIVGIDLTTLSQFAEMSMIDMSQQTNQLANTDWTKELVYEILPNSFRINTIPQMFPFCYYKQSFAAKIERAVNG